MTQEDVLQIIDEAARDERDTLDLSEEGLTALPPEIGQLQNLRTLALNKNRLAALPPEIGQLQNLRTLALNQNQLTALPPEIGQLRNLRGLWLYRNQLARLPVEIAHLESLRKLVLSGNKLDTIAPEIIRLINLTSLIVADNALLSVPPDLSHFTKLQILHLAGNALTAVPSEIGKLTNLLQLSVQNNQLTVLPPEIGQLQSLQFLDLEGNQLTTLPPELGQLRKLQKLDLKDNPLPEPYPDFIKRGTAAVLTYLRSLQKESTPQYEAKLLLVGEGNVGKTSLVEAMRAEPTKRSGVFVKDRTTTHGINLGRLQLDHPGDQAKKLTLNTWDFGGQEVYRVTHQFFFSRRSLYLLVWWPREGQEAGAVEGWLKRIRLRVPDARVILVSTHADEPRQPELYYAKLDRRFPGVLAGRHAVDCESGNGIDDLLETVAAEAAKLPQMGKLMSVHWIAARDEALALEQPQISRTGFNDIAGRHELDEKETETLLGLLHDLGRIVYYGEDEGLRDVVVIRPEWLTKAIGYVLEDKATREAKGELAHGRLRKIWIEHDQPDWERYDTKYHPFFLRLMEKFDISYRIPDQEASLVGQLVPDERPELPWETESETPKGWRELSVLCSMGDQPPGIVSWLTVRNHKYSWEQLHWREGVFLAHRGQEGLFELLEPTELRLTVRGRSPDYFFGLLRDTVTNLIRSRWEGLNYELLVPCPGTKKNGDACDYRFGLEDLQGLREDEIQDHRCIRCREVQNVALLLTGLEAPISPTERKLEEILRYVKTAATAEQLEQQRSESATQMRTLLNALSDETRECPRLFTIVPTGGGAFREKFELTLWCEHPGEEHPCEDGEYTFHQTKEWLADLGPYLSIVATSLRVVVALAGMPGADQIIEKATSKQLESMEKFTKELAPSTKAMGDELGSSISGLTRAQGSAFRQFHSLLLELDPNRKWAGMRRFPTAAGDYLWICPEHHREYDPGLPKLPQ